jgi:hypothetical protein
MIPSIKGESYDHTHPPGPFRHNTWIQYPSHIKLHGLVVTSLTFPILENQKNLKLSACNCLP